MKCRLKQLVNEMRSCLQFWSLDCNRKSPMVATRSLRAGRALVFAVVFQNISAAAIHRNWSTAQLRRSSNASLLTSGRPELFTTFNVSLALT